MNLWKATWTIARKDLRIYFRDRTGMLFGFALPLVLVTVFGFVMKFAFGNEGGLSKTTLWVADLDGSKTSAAFVEALRGASTLRVQPKPGEAVPSAEELRKKVEDGEAHHALLVEPGFGEAIDGGKLPRLRLYRDPGREMESQMVSVGLLQAFFSTAGGKSAPILTARALHLMG
ncbi:MAG TPA: ABC transporter permease, partial [Planctomycetota bacterium]|nr:ABC transporter permease [Planctomycetota bacterium]